MQSGTDLRQPPACLDCLGEAGEALGIDADREDIGAQSAPFDQHPAPAKLDAAKFVAQESREIAAVGLRLEADHTIREHGPYEPLRIGKRGQHFRWGKRDVQEETDWTGEAVGPDLRAERNEMIVVHPDDVLALEEWTQPSRHPLVDAPIGLRKAPFEAGEVESVMEDRPQGLVGETAVEFLDICRRHVDGGKLDAAFRLDLQRPERAFFAGLARPAEPDAAAFPQHIAYANGEAAGGSRVVQGSDAIGDDEEPIHSAFPSRSTQPVPRRKG